MMKPFWKALVQEWSGGLDVMTIQLLVDACFLSIINFATSLARLPILAITIPSLSPSWTSRFPSSTCFARFPRFSRFASSTCFAPGTPRLPAFHTGESGRKDRSSFNTWCKNTVQPIKRLQGTFWRNIWWAFTTKIFSGPLSSRTPWRLPTRRRGRGPPNTSSLPRRSPTRMLPTMESSISWTSLGRLKTRNPSEVDSQTQEKTDKNWLTICCILLPASNTNCPFCSKQGRVVVGQYGTVNSMRNLEETCEMITLQFLAVRSHGLFLGEKESNLISTVATKRAKRKKRSPMLRSAPLLNPLTASGWKIRRGNSASMLSLEVTTT